MNHVYILGRFAQLHRGERWNVPSYRRESWGRRCCGRWFRDLSFQTDAIDYIIGEACGRGGNITRLGGTFGRVAGADSGGYWIWAVRVGAGGDCRRGSSQD